jgi:hypothetical protein
VVTKRIAVTGSAPSDWLGALTDRLTEAGWTLHPLALGGAPGERSGPALDAVVLFDLDTASLVERPFAETDEAAWDAAAEAPARRALIALQAAYRQRAESATVFVIVQPATALEGAAGLVAATTGWEAARVLVKSAARRWGPIGFRANIVGVAADSLVGSVPDDAVRTERVLGPTRRSRDSVIDTILLLLTPEAAALTGATLVADSGALMLP